MVHWYAKIFLIFLSIYEVLARDAVYLWFYSHTPSGIFKEGFPCFLNKTIAYIFWIFYDHSIGVDCNSYNIISFIIFFVIILSFLRYVIIFNSLSPNILSRISSLILLNIFFIQYLHIYIYYLKEKKIFLSLSFDWYFLMLKLHKDTFFVQNTFFKKWEKISPSLSFNWYFLMLKL